MIQEQYPFIDEQGQEHNDLIKHYSDDGKMIVQKETGAIYVEAIDVVPCRFTYEEVEKENEDETNPA